MKKFIYIMILLFLIFTFINFNKNTIAADENSEIKIINEKRIINNYDEVYPLDAAIIGLKNNKLYYDNSYSSYLMEIKEEIKDLKALIDLDNLYLLIKTTNYKIYQFDLKKFELKKEINLEIDKVNTFSKEKNLTICGQIHNDGLILMYDNNLNKISNYYYNGDGIEEIENIKYYNECYYVILKKNGIDKFNNLLYEISNNGNIDENKIVLLKYDIDFNYLDIRYFNEGEFIDLLINNDTLLLSLKDNDKANYYNFTLDFIMVNYSLNNEQNMILLANYKNDSFLLMNKNNGNLYLDNKLIKELFIMNIVSSFVDEGVCKLYLKNNNDVCFISLREYSIDKMENKYCNKDYLEYDNCDNIKVSSYFSLTYVSLLDIDPFFSKTIHGEYDATYQIKFSDGYSFNIMKKIIIDKYTNFVDNGIYPVGYHLYFFGTAVLDEKIIYNGTILDQEGEYDIYVKDCQKHSEKYHLIVKKNYENSHQDHNLNYDYLVGLNKPFSYNLYLDKEMNIDQIKLFINGSLYDNIKINKNELMIIFNTLNRGTYTYHIDYLLYDDGIRERKIIIDKLLTVCVNCADYSYETKRILGTNDLEINLKLNDVQRNFKYFILRNNQDNYLITSDTKLKINGDVVLSMIFMDEGNNMIEKKVLHYEADQEENIDIKFNYHANYVDEAKVKVDLPKQKEDIKVLDINEKSVLSYYTIEDNLSLFYIMLLVSILLLFIGLIFLIIKLKKKKRQQI